MVQQGHFDRDRFDNTDTLNKFADLNVNEHVADAAVSLASDTLVALGFDEYA